jgi:hypothetical protein
MDPEKYATNDSLQIPKMAQTGMLPKNSVSFPNSHSHSTRDHRQFANDRKHSRKISESFVNKASLRILKDKRPVGVKIEDILLSRGEFTSWKKKQLEWDLKPSHQPVICSKSRNMGRDGDVFERLYGRAKVQNIGPDKDQYQYNAVEGEFDIFGNIGYQDLPTLNPDFMGKYRKSTRLHPGGNPGHQYEQNQSEQEANHNQNQYEQNQSEQEANHNQNQYEQNQSEQEANHNQNQYEQNQSEHEANHNQYQYEQEGRYGQDQDGYQDEEDHEGNYEGDPDQDLGQDPEDHEGYYQGDPEHSQDLEEQEMYQENPETGFQEIPEDENPGIYNTDEKQTLENMVAN